jgi:hypothetical protein
MYVQCVRVCACVHIVAGLIDMHTMCSVAPCKRDASNVQLYNVHCSTI